MLQKSNFIVFACYFFGKILKAKANLFVCSGATENQRSNGKAAPVCRVAQKMLENFYPKNFPPSLSNCQIISTNSFYPSSKLLTLLLSLTIKGDTGHKFTNRRFR